MVRAKIAAKSKRALLNLEVDKPLPPVLPAAGAHAPSRNVQKKITRKVKFLERVAASKPLATKSGVAKKKKKWQPSAALNSLPLLSESLAEAVAQRASTGGDKRAKPPGASVGSARGRERVAEAELPRVQAVLAHPQFQADPIAAITSHLSATLPPQLLPKPALKPAEEQQRRRDKKRRQRQRASAAKHEAAGEMVDD
eukprot:scaffold19.g1807.t1